jgi:hypothetical protein
MAGNTRRRVRIFLPILAAIVFLAAGCSDDDDDGDSEDDAVETTTADAGDDDAAGSDNACPTDGCTIAIADVTSTDDGELELTFDANFIPDFSANHIHIYWDSFTADQVSADAADRDVEQGAWVATDAYPTYTTEADVSIATRGDSETLCVTAGDGDHNVLDSSIFECISVTDSL